MVWLKEWIWVVMNDASWENELMEVKQRHSVCYKCEMIIWCLFAQCFKWTGENSFFIKGDLDCFAIGGGR